jgi:YrbI family 3-deoxy-D-manno-octulosonate 8-phosphate phosphatase
MTVILNNNDLCKKASRIRFFFTDVDGTLTDGCTYYTAVGESMKKFSHLDGTGFLLLKLAGIKAGIITGENNEIVKRRAEKLNIDLCFIGIKNKLSLIKEFANSKKISLKEVAYIGDDLNDLQLFSNVGLSFATGNAHKLIKQKADICCELYGGQGVFREAVELLLSLQNKNIIELFDTY